MRVHEVVGGALAVDDDVVAGVGLVLGVLDDAAAGGDERGAAGRHHVLALVGVAGAAGAEAAGAEAEFVGAEDREGVAVEGEAEAERGRARSPCGPPGPRQPAGRSGSCTCRCGPGRPSFVVPSQRMPAGTFGGDVVAVEGLDDRAGGVDDVDLQVVLGLAAADRVAEAGEAEAEVEGLARRRFRGDEAEGAGAGGGARRSGGAARAAAGCRSGWGRRRPSPRRAAPREPSSATMANMQIFAASPSLAIPLLRTASPLFRSPTELAVGLALKEMRYGRFRPIRPGDLHRSLRFLRPRSDARTGFGIAGAAV